MRALVVDDSDINRQVLRLMLEDVFVEVEEADGGSTALAMIEARDYDVLLLDLRMPRLDGLTILQRIRAREDAKRALHVIVVTADGLQEMRERAASAGSDAFLLKPVAPEALYECIALAAAKAQGSIASAA